MPEATAKRSETRNHPRSAIHPKMSGLAQPKTSPPDRKGKSTCPTLSTRGDWVIPPPVRVAKISRDRNLVMPGARMFMATPEMMWSTPKPTVATAWSRPPAAPPAIPMAIPHHGPNSSAPQAPNHVPRIIMPSRPMLTTPALSAQMPPRPARRMGTARRNVDPAVPAEMRSVVSGRANSWVTDRTRTSPRMAIIQRRARDSFRGTGFIGRPRHLPGRRRRVAALRWRWRCLGPPGPGEPC